MQHGKLPKLFVQCFFKTDGRERLGLSCDVKHTAGQHEGQPAVTNQTEVFGLRKTFNHKQFSVFLREMVCQTLSVVNYTADVPKRFTD